jgi:hypothetical protein
MFFEQLKREFTINLSHGHKQVKQHGKTKETLRRTITRKLKPRTYNIFKNYNK